MCTAVAGMALGQYATAQTTRPILTRDVDRGAAQPVNGTCTAAYYVNNVGAGKCVLFTVPAGKRLVVETVSYYVNVDPSLPLLNIVFGLNTPSANILPGSPNTYTVSTTPTNNGVSLYYSASQALHIYIDEAQSLAAAFQDSGGANYDQTFSFSGYLVDK
jgi:hypothetical protein